ncbi:MAG: hypothetical protein CMJ48_02645 [Planctomycetaceae bacterium]|nr:hypothetical protein [Planctomycetaceae bacterium]
MDGIAEVWRRQLELNSVSSEVVMRHGFLLLLALFVTTGAIRADEDPPRETRVVRLQNSPASDVASTLQRALGDRGNLIVVPEPVSNSLVISSTAETLQRVVGLLEALDKVPRMLAFEVAIVELEGNQAAGALDLRGDLDSIVRNWTQSRMLKSLERVNLTTLEDNMVSVQTGRRSVSSSRSAFSAGSSGRGGGGSASLDVVAFNVVGHDRDADAADVGCGSGDAGDHGGTFAACSGCGGAGCQQRSGSSRIGDDHHSFDAACWAGSHDSRRFTRGRATHVRGRGGCQGDCCAGWGGICFEGSAAVAGAAAWEDSKAESGKRKAVGGVWGGLARRRGVLFRQEDQGRFRAWLDLGNCRLVEMWGD